MSKIPQIIDPDELVRGATNIAKVLNLFDDDGKPDRQRAFYVLQKGYVDASKLGRQWISTRRRLLAPLISPREDVDAA